MQEHDTVDYQRLSDWYVAGDVGQAQAVAVTIGGWVELQRYALAWVGKVMSMLSAGSLLVIDYGDTSEDLALRRASGTLRTYQSHHRGPDPSLNRGRATSRRRQLLGPPGFGGRERGRGVSGQTGRLPVCERFP